MPSRVVHSFSYDAEKQILHVVFTSGNSYQYLNVPEEAYHAMKNSFSKGEYLNKHIKGHYDFKRIK
jgi:hypothetical protein